MENHRATRIKFVKIVAIRRDNGAKAIVTCDVSKMAQQVKALENKNYKIDSIS